MGIFLGISDSKLAQEHQDYQARKDRRLLEKQKGEEAIQGMKDTADLARTKMTGEMSGANQLATQRLQTAGLLEHGRQNELGQMARTMFTEAGHKERLGITEAGEKERLGITNEQANRTARLNMAGEAWRSGDITGSNADYLARTGRMYGIDIPKKVVPDKMIDVKPMYGDDNSLLRPGGYRNERTGQIRYDVAPTGGGGGGVSGLSAFDSDNRPGKSRVTNPSMAAGQTTNQQINPVLPSSNLSPTIQATPVISPALPTAVQQVSAAEQRLNELESQRSSARKGLIDTTGAQAVGGVAKDILFAPSNVGQELVAKPVVSLFSKIESERQRSIGMNRIDQLYKQGRMSPEEYRAQYKQLAGE